MKFKVDENLPQEASDLLRASGYDAMSVLEQTLGGKPDPQVYAVCQADVLVTPLRGVTHLLALCALGRRGGEFAQSAADT